MIKDVHKKFSNLILFSTIIISVPRTYPKSRIFKEEKEKSLKRSRERKMKRKGKATVSLHLQATSF